MLKKDLPNLKLNRKEKLLIMAIRNHFRYGEVIVIVRNGIPQRIKVAWRSEDLT